MFIAPVRKRVSRSGLGSLGAGWTAAKFNAPVSAVAVAGPVSPQRSTGSVIFISPVPAGGLMEGYTDGVGAYRTRPVPRTVPYTSPTGTFYPAAPNGDWMPPGYTFQGTANALARQGKLRPSWSPPMPPTKAAFLASQPSGDQRTSVSTFGGQFPAQPVTYFSSPQYEMDIGLWWKFGIDAGYLPKPKTEWISKAIEYAVEAIVIAGIAYGAWLAAAQATAAAPATTAAPAATAPAAAAPEAATAATGTTAATTGTTAAGAAKTAAGYFSQAKDIYGVAQTIRAMTSQPPSAAPAPSLDTTYGGGAGSGGGEGGAGGAASWLTQLSSGNTPLYIGLGLAAVFVALSLPQAKRRAP